MLKRLAQLEFAIASLLLAVIVLLVFVAAIMRFFDDPLIWSVDMAQLLFIWLCFFGATRAMRQKAHIGIDVLVRHIGHRYRFVLEMLVSAIILVFLAILTVEGCKLTLLNRQRLFGDSGFSYAWVTGAVPVGCVMLGIALLWNMGQAWKSRRDNETLVYSGVSSDAAPASEL